MNDRPTYGPWRPGIGAAERRARLRSLRAIAGLVAGPRADPLVGFLLAAETDDAALDLAAAAMTPAQAGGLDADTRTRNALSDISRAQRDQSESLRSIERHQREQARIDRQDRQNAERDFQSMRRFDR